MSKGHLQMLGRLHLETYDAAVKHLDDYLNTYYAPHQPDEPMTPADRDRNEPYYRELRNRQKLVRRANENLIAYLRRELEGMT